MRFETPSYASDAQEQHLGQRCGGADIEDGAAAFCVPADGVHCKGCKWDPERGVCFRNDCDALFTPADLRRRQLTQWAPDPHPQLIITAGPERSGSTWLFNAVRLLFQHARKPLDAYWLKDVTDAALDARGVGKPGAHHVLIKTHAWSEEFDLGRATHGGLARESATLFSADVWAPASADGSPACPRLAPVFVTHRDLRQVLASFRRMTWEYELPDNYVDHHMRWREVAEADLAFEDIIGRPEAVLADLAARMGLHEVDTPAVLHVLSTLPVPKDWVDPVTQIWPSHISTPYMEARQKAVAGIIDGGNDGGGQGASSFEEAMGEGMQPPTPTLRAHLNREAADRLVERFPEYFELYNYL